MNDKEKQIEEMSMSMLKWAELNNKFFDTKGAYSLAEYLMNMNYRKMDTVTLKLDLGDRTPEEIEKITEMFNGEIKKQVAKEIIELMKRVQAMFYDKEYVAIQNLIAEKYGVEVDE